MIARIIRFSICEDYFPCVLDRDNLSLIDNLSQFIRSVVTKYTHHTSRTEGEQVAVEYARCFGWQELEDLSPERLVELEPLVCLEL